MKEGLLSGNLFVVGGMAACLLGLFACAHTNTADQIPDLEGDAETREVLESTKKPEGMDSYTWSRARKMHKLQMAENADVLFYGRVLDPDRRPIVEAVVKGEVTAYDSGFLKVFTMSDDDQKKITWAVTTDTNGCFMVDGMKGRSLKVASIESPGYYSPPNESLYLMSERAYGHNVHRPDKEHPIDFIIWPLSDAVATNALVKKSIRVFGYTDGSVYKVNIIDGRYRNITIDADKPQDESPLYDLTLAVSANNDTNDLRAKYDWSVTVSAAPGGGVIQTQEKNAYKAPVDGYMSNLVVLTKKDDPSWDKMRRFVVYIKGREGMNYASLSFEVYAQVDGRADIEIESVANITGSVNLMPLPRGP